MAPLRSTRRGHRVASVRRVLSLGALSATAVILMGVGAVAYACTAIATLTVSTTSGLPGSMVDLTGKGFKVGVPVTVNMYDATSAATGPVLAQAIPEAGGKFAVSVQVPAAAAGTQVISASQTAADGTPISRMAAGAVFQVLDASPPPAAADAKSSLTGLLVTIAAAAVLVLGLGVGGVMRRQRRNVPESDASGLPEQIETPVAGAADEVELASVRVSKEGRVGAAH